MGEMEDVNDGVVDVCVMVVSVGWKRWRNKTEFAAFLETLSETFFEELDEMWRKVRDDVKCVL